MTWKIEFTKDSFHDIDKLDNSLKVKVYKAILKVSENPLPVSEGGYGKPLGNKHGLDLSGLLKIKLNKDGIRIVYQLIRTADTMKIIIVSVRDDYRVYKEAYNRKTNKRKKRR